uniref:Uncharacterized protein n=1 Tax=viral metagenome TaxID=1070528 RepID=A0A6M3IK42_9ZZZZ
MKLFTNKQVDEIYDKIKEAEKYGEKFKVLYYTSGVNLGKYALLTKSEVDDSIFLQGAIIVVSNIEG